MKPNKQKPGVKPNPLQQGLGTKMVSLRVPIVILTQFKLASKELIKKLLEAPNNQ